MPWDISIDFLQIIRLLHDQWRMANMQQDRQAKENMSSIMKPEFAGTDAQKVKQQIQKDVSEGQGAMTSREAGAMRD